MGRLEFRAAARGSRYTSRTEDRVSGPHSRLGGSFSPYLQHGAQPLQVNALAVEQLSGNHASPVQHRLQKTDRTEGAVKTADGFLRPPPNGHAPAAAPASGGGTSARRRRRRRRSLLPPSPHTVESGRRRGTPKAWSEDEREPENLSVASPPPVPRERRVPPSERRTDLWTDAAPRDGVPPAENVLQEKDQILQEESSATGAAFNRASTTHPEPGPWPGGRLAVAGAPHGPSAPPEPPPSTEPVCTKPAGRPPTRTAGPGPRDVGPRVRRKRCRRTTRSGLENNYLC